jgi:glucose/mannose-6-phosphate isomerase
VAESAKTYTDSLFMWREVEKFPDYLDKGYRKGSSINDLPEHENIENIVFLGMGGSAFSCELAAGLSLPVSSVPIDVIKTYEIPGYIGRNTLVVAVSFSGDTEETLEACEEAYETGAFLLAISTGGKLMELASDWKIPFLRVSEPIPQPRASLPYLTGSILAVLETLGFYKGAGSWIEQCVSYLNDSKDRIFNTAEVLADKINGTLILSYGADPLGALAAKRFKNQINENAKCPAFYNEYPELCHNELAGWGVLGDVTRQVFSLVQFKCESQHPQVSRRMQWVAETLRESVQSIHNIESKSDLELGQVMELIMTGDAASIKLAFLEGVDPGPVPVLGELKEFLKKY